MAHVAEWKKSAVAQLEEMVRQYPVIGVSNIESLPASQFQELREKMRGKAVIRVAKINLLKIAFDNAGVNGLEQLDEYMNGPTAVIFSEIDPFRLFKMFKSNKSKAAAKTGQIAPFDIVVPKGDTGLPPGPALGELKAAGINVKIDGGTIKVIKDSLVVKKGETISGEQAAALSKLGLKPMEIGITLEAAVENGMLFTSEVLNIDEEETLANLLAAYMNGFNLSYNAGFYTKDNIEIFLMNAFTNARNLGVEATIFDKGVIDFIITKAAINAKAVSSLVK